MSKFAEQHTTASERRQHAWERRKENARMCNDTAKLVFAAVVLTQFSNLSSGSFNYSQIMAGCLLTALLVLLSNKFLKD